MKNTGFQTLLAFLFVWALLFHLFETTNLVFRFLHFIQTQVIEPPKAPSWKPRSTEEGKHAKDIRQGELALGVNEIGDYAPMALVAPSGAVRAAGRHLPLSREERWVPIRVDSQGRAICSNVVTIPGWLDRCGQPRYFGGKCCANEDGTVHCKGLDLSKPLPPEEVTGQ